MYIVAGQTMPTFVWIVASMRMSTYIGGKYMRVRESEREKESLVTTSRFGILFYYGLLFTASTASRSQSGAHN